MPKFAKVAAEKLQELRRDFDMNFAYSFSGKAMYRHGYSADRSQFSLIYDGKIPADLAKINRMQKVEMSDGSAVYFFCAEVGDDGVVELKTTTEAQIVGNLESMRIKQKDFLRLQEEMAVAGAASKKDESQVIAVEELAEMMGDKRCCFFTGAGLSATVIPDWNGLMSAMGFDGSRGDEENLRATFATISTEAGCVALMRQLHEVHRSFIHGKPTPAHEAIARISSVLDQAVFTDNRDLIHQNSGVDSIHACQVLKVWRPHVDVNPLEIDLLLVCGMGGDRRGFIQHLKDANPNLRVVNINRDNALGGDFFLPGDVQEVLPQLEMELVAAREMQNTGGGSFPEDEAPPTTVQLSANADKKVTKVKFTIGTPSTFPF